MILKCIINKALIAIDVLLTGLFHKNLCENNKNIAIVFQQVLGDSVVISHSLKEYVKLFPKEDGYVIEFIARPSVLNFMREVLPLPKEIYYVEIDYKKFYEDFLYYRKIKKTYLGKYGMTIVPGTSMSGELFSIISCAPRRIGLIQCMPMKSPLVIFQKLAYTELIRPDKGMMMLQKHRLLLNHLGDKDYMAGMPKLLPKERIIKDSSYCVLSPGASKTEKCWPSERFAEVMDYVIEKYHMSVHLCGGTEEKKYGSTILLKMKNKQQVVDHIGKTTFDAWSSIIQYADLVIGNDSATLHMAAASNRRAVCISGIYDKYAFFPYKVDILRKGERLPETIITDKPCAWCRTIGYNAGYGNATCKTEIKKGKCALCIDEITVEQVKNAIDKILST